MVAVYNRSSTWIEDNDHTFPLNFTADAYHNSFLLLGLCEDPAHKHRVGDAVRCLHGKGHACAFRGKNAKHIHIVSTSVVHKLRDFHPYAAVIVVDSESLQIGCA